MERPLLIDHCLSPEAFANFLEITGLSYSFVGEIKLVVHALVGDVTWLILNGQLCIGGGTLL